MSATAPAETGLVPSSVDPQISAAIAIFDRLEPLKNALGVGNLTVPELQLFAMVAHRTGLDPFSRQIYAVKRGDKVVHQTGIDGYRSVAERTGQYLGSDEATFEPCSCDETPADHPAVARVVIHRAHPSGHVIDQVGIARWHELKPPASNSQDQMWVKMPFNQLAKCAEANGLRKAFPRVLGDVYITEEMAQAGPSQDGTLVEAAAKPTAGERIAARRAAVEGQVIEHLPAQNGPGAPDDPGQLSTSTPTVDAAASPGAGDEAGEPAGLSNRDLMRRAQELGYTGAETVAIARELFEGYDPQVSGGLTTEQRGRLAAELESRRSDDAAAL